MNVFPRRQISVALRNEPGQLARVCVLLAERGVNIDAISVVDNVEQGMIRLLTSDPALARGVLESSGYYVVEAEVLEVELDNCPGVLAGVAAALAQAGLNIDYAYGTEGSRGDSMRVCFKLPDARRAAAVLRAAGSSGPVPVA